jgi:glycosyltransferase involved in cell wall biosynthesis
MLGNKHDILFVSHDYRLLGASKVLMEVMDFFNRQPDCRIETVICPADGPFVQRVLSKRIPVLIPESFEKYFRHIEKPYPVTVIQWMRRLVDNVRLCRFLTGYFRKSKARIVYVNTMVARYAALPARLTGKRLIWHVHEYSRNRWKQRFQTFLIRACADRVVLHSPFLADRLGLKQNQRRKIVYFNYLSLMPPPWDSAARPAGIQEYDILFAGKISREKGFLDLILAVDIIAGKGIPLRIAATGNLLEKDGTSITDRIRECGLEKSFFFPGFVPSLTTYFQKARIVALPTHRDYFPMLLMEAIAFGRPMVSTRVGEIHTLVRDGVNGLLVAPGDTQALADAIQHILNKRNYPAFLRGARLVRRELQSISGDFARLREITGWGEP